MLLSTYKGSFDDQIAVVTGISIPNFMSLAVTNTWVLVFHGPNWVVKIVKSKLGDLFV